MSYFQQFLQSKCMNYPILSIFYAEQALNFSVFGLTVLLRLHHFKLIFPKIFRGLRPLAPGQGRCPWTPRWSKSLGGSAASLAAMVRIARWLRRLARQSGSNESATAHFFSVPEHKTFI